ncbi:MAG: hypothetical protein JW764_08490 [Chlorobiaceae bacterium]|nr:hypothetical protein [Chlorobiaceae bacterium]
MKKIAEQIYTEWFLKEKGWEDFELVESEKPDFILLKSDEKIGIEITNLYKNEGSKGSPIKTQESHNNEWLQEIASKYYNSNNPPIKIDILFKRNQKLIKIDNIVRQIEKNIPSNPADSVEFEIEAENDTFLKLFIMRLPDNDIFFRYKRWSFINNHVGLSRIVELSDLKKKIDNKRQKSKKYSKNLDALILLIVADGANESGMFHKDEESIDLSCDEFDEIYFINHLLKVEKIG